MTKVAREVPEEVASLKTKSARIRALDKEGWPCGDIARALGIRYQHAYSVLRGNRQRTSADVPAPAASPAPTPKASPAAAVHATTAPAPAAAPAPMPKAGPAAGPVRATTAPASAATPAPTPKAAPSVGPVRATTAPRENLPSRGADSPSKVWDLDLPPKVKELDDGLRRYIEVCAEKLGLVPNVIMANALDSERLRTFVDSYNRLMLAEGRLTKGEREMIAVAVSSANRCFYCLVAHGAALRQISGDPGLAEAIAFNYRAASLSPRHRAMLDFATKLTESPSRMDREDQKALRKAGFDDLAILEIAEVAGFFNMSNRIAAATGMMPNPEYHAVAR